VEAKGSLMPKHLARAANRPILVRRVQLRWYLLALLPILALGWLALRNLIPALFMPLILFALVFWLASFVMAVIAKLRTPKLAKSAPESRP
jgi:hypothetical protein